MIRNIVGSLVYVASGKQSLKWLIDVKNSKNRSLAAPTFSPSGLYLSGVYYEEKWEIPFNNKDFMFNYL
jgi:tRNA pseudouridine38-40 synthase